MINLAYFEAWLSLVERCVRDAEVVGSNPVASTTWQGQPEMPYLSAFPVLFYVPLKAVLKVLFDSVLGSSSNQVLTSLDYNTE